MMTIHLVSWLMFQETPLVAVTRMLGECDNTQAAVEPGQWIQEDTLVPDEPIGVVRSVLTFCSQSEGEVDFVPGSQGQPPPGASARCVRTVRVTAGTSLALDARCWYRVTSDAPISVTLWRAIPRRTRS